jgi:integrase-like protein
LTAQSLRQACERLGVTQSMGRPGSALDNAVIESWHSTLEFELRSVEHFTTKAAARAKVAAWIKDYNTCHRHSACQMMPPVTHEKHWRPEMPAFLPPARMRHCSGLSRSFLRGPGGPCGGSTWTTPTLRRSHRARETAGGNKIRITKVSTVLGEPR